MLTLLKNWILAVLVQLPLLLYIFSPLFFSCLFIFSCVSPSLFPPCENVQFCESESELVRLLPGGERLMVVLSTHS